MSNAGITLNINLDAITKSLGKINGLGGAIELGVNKGILELTSRLKSKLMENMMAYGLGGSPLMGAIEVKPIGKDGISIHVGDYAMYVEFGTGIVGAGDPHPKANGWIYDVNSHGDKGWYYPTSDADPNPWKHYYNGKLYAWTKGQKSRPFMYETWLWGSRSATQIIRKNINAEIKKIGGK